jgi:hypothetical protein
VAASVRWRRSTPASALTAASSRRRSPTRSSRRRSTPLLAGCGRSPRGPLPFRVYTTFKQFRRWGAVMGGIYLFGHLRPAKPVKRARMHPQIAR